VLRVASPTDNTTCEPLGRSPFTRGSSSAIGHAWPSVPEGSESTGLGAIPLFPPVFIESEEGRDGVARRSTSLRLRVQGAAAVLLSVRCPAQVRAVLKRNLGLAHWTAFPHQDVRRTALLRLLTLAQIAGLIFMTESSAWAYVDPGSGFLAFQMLGASLAGAAFFLRHKLRRLFRVRSGKMPLEPPPASAAPDAPVGQKKESTAS
jgi:hypothetical protein